MKTKSYILLITLLAVAFQACKNSSKKEGDFAMVNLAEDDKTFLALKDTAQKHIPEFANSLKLHGSDTANYTFIAKSDFEENGTHEHMWSRLYTIDNNVLKGELIDSAFNLKRIKLYDKVEIKLKEVEDWIVYDNVHKQKLGGYSEKYLEGKQ